MSIQTQASTESEVVYPESDGRPIADNTKQFRWIVTLHGNLDAIFRDDPRVFVASDLLWYPIQGDNATSAAPDAMVVFGRPKGDRGSYRQWDEDHLAPQVVFEVLSPNNRISEMVRKFKFYERFGVEEYYVYDPDTNELDGWLRRDGELREIANMDGWVSPRLGIRFEHSADELRIYTPDGQPFATSLELFEQRDSERQRAETEHQRAETERQRAETEHQRAETERQRAETERQQAETERQQAETERQRAETEHQRAETEHQRAETERQRAETERQQAETERQRAETERQQAETERQRAERLAAQLKALGVEPDQ